LPAKEAIASFGAKGSNFKGSNFKGSNFKGSNSKGSNSKEAILNAPTSLRPLPVSNQNEKPFDKSSNTTSSPLASDIVLLVVTLTLEENGNEETRFVECCEKSFL
jgi:uncharacterized protein YjbI with pentapeptide repeats